VNTSELRKTLKEAAVARVACRGIEEAFTASYEAVKSTPEWQAYDLIAAALRASREHVTRTENDAKALALQISPVKGRILGIVNKTVKSYEYDVDAAEQWCFKNLSGGLRLDAKVFEHVAPALNGAPIKVVETLKAYIDSDLSAYMTDDDSTREEH